MTFVDGFIAPVRIADKAKYLDYIRRVDPVFRECGALRVVDCWADDLEPGKLTSFPRAVNRKDDEAVAFGWIEWPSKAARDAGFQKAMEHPAMKGVDMPFDGARMVFGGFDVLAEF